jgi:DNA-binding MarR family transcriptional regulator
MSGPTRSVLSLLTATCPSQRELASALRVTPQTMSATLERLEQVGYIERSRDPDDRRRSLCRLTEKGRLALTEADSDESPLLHDDRRDDLLRQLLIELIARHPDQVPVDAHDSIEDHG